MRTLIALLVAGLALASGSASGETSRELAADGPLEVELASGRRYSGDVDPRTDAARLWLRTGSASMHVARPIEWNRVVKVIADGTSYAAEEFVPVARQRAAELTAAATQAVESPASDLREAAGSFRTWHTAPPREAEPPRVATLQVDAYLANWDADVEPDGLEVHIYPVDRYGNFAAVRGTLVAQLYGQRPLTPPAANKFPRLGHWSRTVTPEDFGPSGAVVRLPFQRRNPEFDGRLNAYGLLHARLNVPGSGTFETSVATLRIRPYSAYRDALEVHRGRRYLPVERLGRTQ